VNYFERNDATVSKQLFAKQIKSTLKLLTAGHDFIPRSSADKLSNFIDRLLETAQNNKKQQNYLHAAYICTAIMEQLIAPLEQGLDSSGYVLDSFSAAYDVLYQIVQQQMPEEARKYLIDDCLKACDQKIYDGWEWHYGILEMTALLSETEEDAKRIFERIDKGQNKAGKLHLVKYKILLKVYPTVYGIITIGSKTEVRCLGGNLQHFLQVALFFHQLYSFS
jgi:galactose-1-phosphate uridylyltransferase